MSAAPIPAPGKPLTDRTIQPMPTDNPGPDTSRRTPPRIARARARRIGFMVFAGVMALIALIAIRVAT